MLSACIVVDIAKVPEVMWLLCHQVADALRDAAMDEDPHTQQRLLEIAASFEAGSEVAWPEKES